MTGNAEGASGAILSWLKGRDAVADEAVEASLLELRRAARRLSEAPLLRNDGLARAIIDEMAAATDMDGLTTALGRLEERLDVLLSRRRNTAGNPRPRASAARTFLRL